jgi:hypothetical protein
MHPINRFFLLAFMVLFAAGCASNKPADGAGDDIATEEGDDELGDMLISFTVRAQSRDYDALLEMVSETDRSKLMDSDGTIRPELLPGLRNLKVSTLQAENVSVLDGKLVGIADVIADAARKVSTSAEQRIAPAVAPVAAPTVAPVSTTAVARKVAPAVAPMPAPATDTEPATVAPTETNQREEGTEERVDPIATKPIANEPAPDEDASADEPTAGESAADEGFPE